MTLRFLFVLAQIHHIAASYVDGLYCRVLRQLFQLVASTDGHASITAACLRWPSKITNKVASVILDTNANKFCWYVETRVIQRQPVIHCN